MAYPDENPGLQDCSWLNPKLVIRASTIEGKGLFARLPIEEGEIVAVWRGMVITDEELRHLRQEKYSSAAIEDGCNLLFAPNDPINYGNHSCDSNVWMQDAVTEVALRPIADGEEVTVDYALFTITPDWQMVCRCGSPLCRHVVTGNDWQLPELQARYRGHFSSFINRRIVAQCGKSSH